MVKGTDVAVKDLVDVAVNDTVALTRCSGSDMASTRVDRLKWWLMVKGTVVVLMWRSRMMWNE